MTYSIVELAAAAILGAGLLSATPGTAQKGDADQQFITQAWEANTVEVTLGQVAMRNAASEEVKQYGKRMMTDHMLANKELMDLVSKNQIFSPKGVSKRHQAMMDQLAALKGPEFDREYIRTMVDDHRKAVSTFEKASKECQDPSLKAWAAQKLPTLREHLKLAQQIEQKVGGK
jgi:putative membrane protein